MSKFQTLVNILDQLRKEAPREFKRYYPIESDLEKLNQARSRAFIHLFLKVKFGLLDFRERERLVTDGEQDGGIDAYFIDEESKKVYLIQSKFRTNANNFIKKEIELRELLNMDVDRITDGEEIDENEVEYSGKIKQLQREMSNIPDSGKYKNEVIILANLKEMPQSKLKKLTGGFGCEVFDYEKTYKELIFPIITGTYYNQNELRIQLNLNNKTSQSSRISYKVETKYINCEISVLFVPTIEIARTLFKYKNSVLKFNPRSYLELSNNTVNKEIEKTITEVKTNEFALYNNGITMLSYATEFNDKVGQKNTAQLIITQPQIINGGQTAFTLSRIYEDKLLDNNLLTQTFSEKEVLLKIITLPNDAIENPKQLELIEAISKATNQQTPVDEADRRSNDKIQIEIQDAIYNSFGYFYERKKGEYADGIKNEYIDKSQVIDRETFIRLCKSCDMSPSEARRSSVKFLFREDNFTKTLNNVDRHIEYFFAYRCYQTLNNIEKKYLQEKNNRYGVVTFGNAIRYGKYAVVAVCKMLFNDVTSLENVEKTVNIILSHWIEFESDISNLDSNYDYFYSYYDTVKNNTFANFQI